MLARYHEQTSGAIPYRALREAYPAGGRRADPASANLGLRRLRETYHAEGFV